MTEGEVTKTQAAQSAPSVSSRQQLLFPPQQQPQNPPLHNALPTTLPSSSLLLQSGVRFDQKYDTSVAINQINSCESNYQKIIDKFGEMSQAELLDSLSNGVVNIKGDNAKALNDGFLCGILVDPVNVEKYISCLTAIADATDHWQCVLTTCNILILECYHHLKQQCRQQLVYFFEDGIKLNIRTLDTVLVNFCRALSDGTEFRETCQSAHNFAQRLSANRQWISSLPPRSIFPSTAFALFSRLITDAPQANNAGIMAHDSFKQPLISICEFLVRERFADLTLMGRDLVLTLMRLARVSQFVPIWRSLLHNPSQLMPKFTGLQQLMMQAPACHLLDYRVSVRISRKMAEILKSQVRAAAISANQQNPGVAKAQQTQLQQELNRLFETLKTVHLSGPDSGSIRAEIIRHVWAMINPKEFNQASIEARATLLSWLLRTAKPGAELQWCKLMFFWEWYGFEPTAPNAHINAEPIISTLRHMLNTGQHLLGNSLVDFLIKSVTLLYNQLSFFFINSATNAMKALETANLQVQAVFTHSKLDQALKDQMRQTFPDFFPKRMTSIADNLAEPSQIIDFDAIRGNATAVATVPTDQPMELDPTKSTTQQTTTSVLTNGKGQAGLEKKVKQEPCEARTSCSDGKLAAAVKSGATTNMDGQQPALKKAKIVTTKTTKSSSSESHLKKKLKKEEGVSNKIGIGREMSPRKRKRRKSNEDGTGGMELAAPNKLASTAPLGPSTSIAYANSLDMPIGALEIFDEAAMGDVDVVEDSEAEEGTSKRMPLSLLLPMVREEFRESLESLDKAMKEGRAGEEEAITAMQNLMDSIFDADEMDNEQREFVALCLIRIFDTFLHQTSYLPDDPSEENLAEAMEHPIYRFFKILSQSAEDAESRKLLLAIAAKMRQECPRVGYLFLYYISYVQRDGNRLIGRGGPSIEQAAAAYKDICKQIDQAESFWLKQLANDLEQCHFDDRELFAHVLIDILPVMTPYGPPPKLMRSICASTDPRLMTLIMSEIVRENIVFFGNDDVLQLLTESLKWDSFEQYILWQLVQTEAVEFDKFMEILQRLNYAQHPEATAAILVIMRNMEPNPDIQVMKNLLRNLLQRPPQKDLFTVDAIKLLIDYEENVPPVADCINKMVKKATHAGDIAAPASSKTTGQTAKHRMLTVECIFGHLDRLRQNCMEKEGQRAEELWENSLFRDMMSWVRKNPKLTEIRAKFDEMFALFDIMDEDGHPLPKGARGKSGHHRKAKAAKQKEGGKIDLDSRDGTPTKRKRRAKTEEDDSDEDWGE